MLCLQSNRVHEVWSTSLQTEDKEYITASDLTDGKELVWVRNKKRLTVRVTQRGMLKKLLIYFIVLACLIEGNECNNGM